MTELAKGITNWFVNGETGLSSMCIASVMLGFKPKTIDHPLDPPDFKRCLLLVNAVPEVKSNLWKMKDVSEQWSALIDRWDDVEKCFMEEVAEWLDTKFSRKSAIRTYDLMKEIGL